MLLETTLVSSACHLSYDVSGLGRWDSWSSPCWVQFALFSMQIKMLQGYPEGSLCKAYKWVGTVAFNSSLRPFLHCRLKPPLKTKSKLSPALSQGRIGFEEKQTWGNWEWNVGACKLLQIKHKFLIIWNYGFS